MLRIDKPLPSLAIDLKLIALPKSTVVQHDNAPWIMAFPATLNPEPCLK
jgi:hypothetical protein